MRSADGERYYVYGFARADTAVPADAAVDMVGGPPVAACVRCWAGDAPQVDAGLAREHARVVAAMAGAGPFLPCPAGTVVSQGELRTWVEGRLERLCDALGRVTGQVEFGLKLWLSQVPPPPDPEGGGRAYMAFLRAAARARAEAQAIADRFLASLEGHVTAAQRAEPRDLLLRVEMLVPAASASTLREQFAALEAGLPPGWGARVSGPWPPYFFAGVMVHGTPERRSG